GEGGQGVDGVADRFVGGGCEEEIDPRQARPVNRLERANGESLNLGGHLRAELSRYDQTRAVVVDVFRLIVVKLGGLRDDLSGQARYRLVVGRGACPALPRGDPLFHYSFSRVFRRRLRCFLSALLVS